MRNKRRAAHRASLDCFAVAKRDALRKISVDKLKEIQAQAVTAVAKRDTLARRVDQVVDYLFWKETSQNETYAQAVPG
jgi:adenylate kinase